MLYNNAQDVLDAYYSQESLIEVDGEKVINPNFRSLFDMIEDYAIEIRERSYRDGQSNILENSY
jgi:hypothetical protein